MTRKDGKALFTITDQSKGIPLAEITDIFTPFKMGSNAESKACGRSVGLALYKSAVELEIDRLLIVGYVDAIHYWSWSKILLDRGLNS